MLLMILFLNGRTKLNRRVSQLRMGRLASRWRKYEALLAGRSGGVGAERREKCRSRPGSLAYR